MFIITGILDITKMATTTNTSSDNNNDNGDSNDNNSNDDDNKINIMDQVKDRYGFFLTDDYHKSLSMSSDVNEQRRLKEAERTIKWTRMLKKGFPYLHQYRKAKLKRRIRKGITTIITKNYYCYYHYYY